LPRVYTFAGMPAAPQIAFLFALAVLCGALLWYAKWLPVAVPVEAARQPEPKQPADPADEQLPETDRAPRGVSHLLTYAVALTAAARVGVLIALHR
jgi:hypothetical protein